MEGEGGGRGGAAGVAGRGVVRVAVFASGGGTNLQALLDRLPGGGVAEVVLMVSDRPGAGALERARRAAVAARVVPVGGRPDEEVARETLAVLEEAGAELVALAGYLRLVPPAVVRRYRHRMVNIHPALLPSFGGKGMYGRRVHEAVLAAGCRVTGATVHLVEEEYDTGRILAQWPVPVLPGDSPETLAERVLRVEHVLYPAAVEALARAFREGQVPGGTTAGQAPGGERPAAFRLVEAEAPGEAEVRASVGV